MLIMTSCYTLVHPLSFVVAWRHCTSSSCVVVTLRIVRRFYARKQLLLSAHLSHRDSVRPSVRHTSGSVKNDAS